MTNHLSEFGIECFRSDRRTIFKVCGVAKMTVHTANFEDMALAAEIMVSF